MSKLLPVVDILGVIAKELFRTKKMRLLMVATGCVSFFIIIGKGYQIGLKKQIDDLQYYGYTGDFIVVNSKVIIKNKPEFLSVSTDEMIDENVKHSLLKEIPQVKYVLPRYVTKCMIMGEDEAIYDYVTLLGIDIETERHIGIFKLFNFISFSNSCRDEAIYISDKIAKKLNLKPKDKVYVFIATEGGMPLPAKFTVEGIFEAKGFPALMNFLACVEVDRLNKILRNERRKYTYFQVMLKNRNELNSLKSKLTKILQTFNCKFYDFDNAAPFFKSIKKAIEYTSYVSLWLQYLVIFLFVYCSIHMLVLARRREIAIMYTIGLSVKDVAMFLLAEIGLLMLLPASVGAFCGLLINYVLSVLGIPAINEAMRYMFASDKLYFDFNILVGLYVVVTITIIGTLAALPSVVYTKNIKITELLRHPL